MSSLRPSLLASNDVAVTAAIVTRRRIEPGLIRLARLNRLRHLVVDLKNKALRPKLAVRGFVLPLDYRKGIHNIGHVVMVKSIKVEECSVKLATEHRAPLSNPAKRLTTRYRSTES